MISGMLGAIVTATRLLRKGCPSQPGLTRNVEFLDETAACWPNAAIESWIR